jgi:hypothetical protein
MMVQPDQAATSKRGNKAVELKLNHHTGLA